MGEGSHEWIRDNFKDTYSKIDAVKAELAETKIEVAVMNSNVESAAVRTEQKLGEIKAILEKQVPKSTAKPPNLANQALSFLFSGKGVAVVIVALVLLFLNGDLAEVLSKILEK